MQWRKWRRRGVKRNRKSRRKCSKSSLLVDRTQTLFLLTFLTVAARFDLRQVGCDWTRRCVSIIGVTILAHKKLNHKQTIFIVSRSSTWTVIRFRIRIDSTLLSLCRVQWNVDGVLNRSAKEQLRCSLNMNCHTVQFSSKSYCKKFLHLVVFNSQCLFERLAANRLTHIGGDSWLAPR